MVRSNVPDGVHGKLQSRARLFRDPNEREDSSKLQESLEHQFVIVWNIPSPQWRRGQLIAFLAHIETQWVHVVISGHVTLVGWRHWLPLRGEGQYKEAGSVLDW